MGWWVSREGKRRRKRRFGREREGRGSRNHVGKMTTYKRVILGRDYGFRTSEVPALNEVVSFVVVTPCFGPNISACLEL